MMSLFPFLSPGLQTKLAQYALLTHRAALLAALPSQPAVKGRPTQWATQPPARVLQAVLFYAGQEATPKVSRALLRMWFQKKTALQAAVREALLEVGYPLPHLADPSEPCPWYVRLDEGDVRKQDGKAYFYPAGQPVAATGDASQEEVTLMAHLLGWSVRPAQVGATPPGESTLAMAAEGYVMLGELRVALHSIAATMPADLAEAVWDGELPTDLSASNSKGDWPTVRATMTGLRTSLERCLHLPPSPEEAPLTLAQLVDLVERIEKSGANSYIYHQHFERSLALLTRVEGLRHRQVPDFAPLAALRARTAAVRATFAAEWPLNETGHYRTSISVEDFRRLIDQADVYALLLRLVDFPDQLAALDETSDDFRALETATPAGVLNALLLRKLAATA